jgi:hypothetical protein
LNLDPDKTLRTDLTNPSGFLPDSSPSRFPEDILEALNKPEKDKKDQSSIIDEKETPGEKPSPDSAFVSLRGRSSLISNHWNQEPHSRVLVPKTYPHHCVRNGTTASTEYRPPHRRDHVDKTTEAASLDKIEESLLEGSSKIAACMYTVIQNLVYLSCPTAWNLIIGQKIEDPPNDIVKISRTFFEVRSILNSIHLS